MNHFQINDFDKATQFITILKTFKSYNDHITFQLLDERLYIQGMDNSHISLYELNIKPNWFSNYQVNTLDQRVISVSSNILTKVLSLFSRDHTLNFFVDEEKSMFQLTFINNNNNNNIKSFEIPLFTIEFDLLQTMDIDYDTNIKLSSKTFSEYINELNIFNSELGIKCNDQELKLTSKSDNGSMTQQISLNDVVDYATDEDSFINIKLEMKFLIYINQLSKSFDFMTLYLHNELPLKITFQNNDQSVSTQFFLAPKLVDDEVMDETDDLENEVV